VTNYSVTKKTPTQGEPPQISRIYFQREMIDMPIILGTWDSLNNFISLVSSVKFPQQSANANRYNILIPFFPVLVAALVPRFWFGHCSHSPYECHGARKNGITDHSHSSRNTASRAYTGLHCSGITVTEPSKLPLEVIFASACSWFFSPFIPAMMCIQS
jgi:hypothetical protein